MTTVLNLRIWFLRMPCFFKSCLMVIGVAFLKGMTISVLRFEDSFSLINSFWKVCNVCAASCLMSHFTFLLISSAILEFGRLFVLGPMKTMCLNLILSHLMQHFLDQRGHHPSAMGFNSSTVTYHQLCSATKKAWSLCLIFFVHTSMMGM